MTAFIGVDWRSSRLRAYRMSDGTVVDRRETEQGIRAVADGAFGPVLEHLLDGWPERRVLLSGMITSRSGWRETGCAPCPAGLDDIVARQIRVTAGGRELHFLPGVTQGGADGRPPDVMRSEEVQILGLPVDSGPCLVVLPGTHSKWASVTGGRIIGLRTFMTGEVFDLVRNHSLAGRVAEGSAKDPAAFADGVMRGTKHATPMADLFSVRPAVRMGALAPGAVDAFLSGLLIGGGIREAAEILSTENADIVLLGSPALTERYATALSILGRSARVGSVETGPAGFARIAACLWRTVKVLEPKAVLKK